jgi:transcription-repair coupling factor (superfamily II helicase)
LPVATEKRLRALTELDRLGAGFEVSRRDLDLRGAGDLLGEAQAGHIRQIGFELYRHLLDRALLQAQTGKVESEATVTLRLDVPASIPADYVSDPEVRINLYARLARLRQPAQMDEFADEIEDRFGPPPPATRNLIDLARIADRARRVGIVHIDAGPVGIAITFSPEAADAARRPVARFGNVHWAGDRAVLERPHDTAERVSLTTELLEELPVRKEAADQ